VEVSEIDIKSRIEEILSEILSDKHDVNITLKFRDQGENKNGDYNTSRIIGEKQVLDKQASSL
jgi:hypothetical protein